jgi:phosphoribosyl 1,2-cyclic phosphodiesterase
MALPAGHAVAAAALAGRCHEAHVPGARRRLAAVGAHDVLIDPFLTGNPKAAVAADALAPGTIVITHAHADHVGDAVAIARRAGARIVSAVEIVASCSATVRTASTFVGANIGGRVAMPFGALRFTPAWHSSSFADGTYGGMPMGVIVEIDGRRVYHAGDTGLFGDMALIGRTAWTSPCCRSAATSRWTRRRRSRPCGCCARATSSRSTTAPSGLIEQDALAFATPSPPSAPTPAVRSPTRWRPARRWTSEPPRAARAPVSDRPERVPEGLRGRAAPRRRQTAVVWLARDRPRTGRWR